MSTAYCVQSPEINSSQRKVRALESGMWRQLAAGGDAGCRHDAFVSYARADAASVMPDIAWLESMGLDIWFDQDIRAGQEWADELASAIEQSQFVLFFVSNRSVESTHCLNEIAYATDAGKPVLPVYLEQLRLSGGLKLSIARAQAILRWQLSSEEYRQRLRYACLLHRDAAAISGAPRPPAAPDAVWMVSAPRNRAFAGRQSTLDRVAQALEEESPAVVVLTGMAGVGKSQVALEYAYRHAQDYELVAWIRGQTRAAIETDLVALAAALQLEHAADPSTAVVVSAVRRYLAERGPWLLVCDNVSHADLVKDFLPTNANGHMLITSRRQNWGRVARDVLVESFDRAEAVAFVEQRLPESDAAAIARLVQVLGGLPLALEEAAAYMQTAGRSIASYLALFHKHHRVLMHEITRVDDYPSTFSTALDLSLQQLESEDPVAARALNLLAFVAPEDIPLSVLWSGELQAQREVPEEIVIDRCISSLARYSLIRVRDGSASVHQLVQLMMRDRMSAEEHERYAGRVLERLVAAFPGMRMMGERSGECRRLLPHALSLFDRHADDSRAAEPLAVLLGRVGTFLSASSWSADATACLERAYQILRKLPDSSDTFAYTCELYGRANYKLGRLEIAQRLFHEALEVYQRSAAANAKRSMQIYVDLAWTAWSQGDFERGGEYAQKSLTAAAAAFGANDPRRMGALSILSRLYLDDNQPDEARRALASAVTTVESVHGYRSPLMCGVFLQIAHVLLSLGELQRAQSWAQAAVELAGPALSRDHPLVATARCILGQVLFLLGDLEAARREFEIVVAALRDSGQRMNQHVVTAACYLVRVLVALDDLPAAELLARERLEHVDGMIAGDAAYAIGLADMAKGELAFRRGDGNTAIRLVTAGDERVRNRYGDLHCYRIDTLLLSGDTQRKAGDYAGARASYELGLRIARHNAIERHPGLAGHLFGLARIQAAEGDSQAARTAHRQAMEILSSTIGPSLGPSQGPSHGQALLAFEDEC